MGGIAFTRGPLAHLLRNRFYIGEVAFSNDILCRLPRGSEALLIGRIFDDCGNRMSPSHARKRGIKHHYYLSSALMQGEAERAGSVRRVPAVEIGSIVIRSVRQALKLTASADDPALVSAYVIRVEIQPEQLVVQLAPTENSNGRKATMPTSFMSFGKRHRPRGGASYYCRTDSSLTTPEPAVQRPELCWSHPSPEDASGLAR